MTQNYPRVVRFEPPRAGVEAFRQSVQEARLQAGLNLGANGFAAGGKIAAACDGICFQYGRGELPTPEQITEIRHAIFELGTLLATYGASGSAGDEPKTQTVGA